MADSSNNTEKMIAPENMGRMNDPDGAAIVKGICGDSMEMYLTIDNGIISNTKFFTDGCSSSRFCGATAARLAKGKSLGEVLRLSPADVIDAWGRFSGVDVHCAILAISALHKALADYIIKTQNG